MGIANENIAYDALMGDALESALSVTGGWVMNQPRSLSLCATAGCVR